MTLEGNDEYRQGAWDATGEGCGVCGVGFVFLFSEEKRDRESSAWEAWEAREGYELCRNRSETVDYFSWEQRAVVEQTNYNFGTVRGFARRATDQTREDEVGQTTRYR